MKFSMHYSIMFIHFKSSHFLNKCQEDFVVNNGTSMRKKTVLYAKFCVISRFNLYSSNVSTSALYDSHLPSGTKLFTQWAEREDKYEKLLRIS